MNRPAWSGEQINVPLKRVDPCEMIASDNNFFLSFRTSENLLKSGGGGSGTTTTTTAQEAANGEEGAGSAAAPQQQRAVSCLADTSSQREVVVECFAPYNDHR